MGLGGHASGPDGGARSAVGADEANGVAWDPAGNVYVAGDTNSTTFPTAHAMQAANAGRYDGFIAKIGALNS